MITIPQLNEILTYIKVNTTIPKHILDYTWISGSSTKVYPISIYTGNKSNNAKITIQVDSKNIFSKTLKKISQFSQVDYAYYDKGDDTKPPSIHIRLKDILNKGTGYYEGYTINEIKEEL